MGTDNIREYDHGIENEDLLSKIHKDCYDKCFGVAKQGLGKK